VVDQHHVGFQRQYRLGNLIRLAAADVIARVWIFDASRDDAQHFGAGGFDQLGELFPAAGGITFAAGMRQHQYGAVALLLSVKH